MQLIAEYNSVWDGGFVITTACTINLLTGVVSPETETDGSSEDVEVLDREYVEINGREFDVEEDGGAYRIVDWAAVKAFVIESISQGN